jgi:hypothetical protein
MAEAQTTEILRPGANSGQAHELTVILPLNPGGADRMRAAQHAGETSKMYNPQDVDKVGTVHDFRVVIFDNDTRLLFASTFDGGWETYINDFATFIPDQINFLFHECVGWPGIHSPDVKDYIVRHQITALRFYSAYPDVTVRDVWKAAKVKNALDNLLDAAG